MTDTAGAPSQVDAATKGLFHGLSSLRGRRAVHPRGIALHAELTLEAPVGSSALQPGVRHDALVRCSRAAGTREPLPDVLGIAFRLEHVAGIDRHQDVLLSSSFDGPLGRRVVRPTGSFFSGSFSSLVAFDAGGERLLLGLLPLERPLPQGDGAFRELLARRLPAFALAVAPAWSGEWRRVGTLELHERLPLEVAERLRFDPWNADAGIVPVDVVNRLRKPAYEGSRR